MIRELLNEKESLIKVNYIQEKALGDFDKKDDIA
jgi:hypothetical protein